MAYAVLLLGMIVVVILVFKYLHSSKNPSSGLSGYSVTNEPRDFLLEASHRLETPKALNIMLEESRDSTINEMSDILESGGIYDRKYVAFALGQIGDDTLIPLLERRLNQESITGVREAIEAALVALRVMSSQNGHSEYDRRRVIEDVYAGRGLRL